ncbi:MAG: MipA/OmpV family protein [Pseudomonadota bacterium]
MRKFVLLALCGVSGAAVADAPATPATNPMPDGSHDMYAGLGLVSAPSFEGAPARRLSLLPVLQAQWSNGVFLSGPAIGMHLSERPALEFGPLLSVQGRRTDSGNSASLLSVPGLNDQTLTGADAPAVVVGAGGGVVITPIDPSAPTTGQGSHVDTGIKAAPPNRRPLPTGWTRLTGMREIGAAVEVGGFVNVYLTPQLRLTNNVLYGGGNAHQGLRWNVDLQHLALEIAPHHTLALSGGLALVNGAYQRSYFGVTAQEAISSANNAYAPAGGVKDVHALARWNWQLGSSWLLASGLQWEHLTGAAARSPLVDRANSATAFSALAYRF